MELEGTFVTSIAQEYIDQTRPQEREFLAMYLPEAEKRGFAAPPSSGKTVPFGFGGSDLLVTLQSPVVVQILLGIWRDILMPLFGQISKNRQTSGEKNKIGEQALKTLSRKKLREYIRGQAKKKLLCDEEADELARRVLDWLRRHPDDIERLISRSA